MGEIIDMNCYKEEPDMDAMNRRALEEYLCELRGRLAQFDEQEPENMTDEAYEQWGERHEELEDLADEVLERLDDMA